MPRAAERSGLCGRAWACGAVLCAAWLLPGCRALLEIDQEYRLLDAGPQAAPDRDTGQDEEDAGQPCAAESCPQPTSDCQVAACVSGRCTFRNRESGRDCFTNGGLRCDGEGQCVRCRVDGRINDSETDVDCGGPECEPCASQRSCRGSGDCQSGICNTEGAQDGACLQGGDCKCDAATCSDGMRNGDEADVDCGGPCLKRCPQGGFCAVDEDCQTGHCADGVCCGVACSGRCERCAPVTGACSFIADGQDPDDECEGASNTCDGRGGCSFCADQTLNGDETDFDCGGETCSPCALTKSCQVDRDCASCLCEGEVCVAPRCGNGVRDGCETDVDCGGTCGPSCGDGQRCFAKADCASYACLSGSCVGP